MAASAVDAHVAFVVARAHGGRQVVSRPICSPRSPMRSGGCVPFDAGDALRAGNRDNVVPLRKEPRQSDL